MRRVIVTPTFAAGLGFVIAAGLVYSTSSRSSLQFGAQAPYNGQPCEVASCASLGVPHQGGLASVTPGQRLLPTPGDSASPLPQGSPTASSPRKPVLVYQTLHKWRGDFVAGFTITPNTRIPSGGWRLRFTYPDNRIVGLWGAKWLPEGRHAAVAEGTGSQERDGQIRLFVAISGLPGPPATCSFDGVPCRIEVIHAASRRAV